MESEGETEVSIILILLVFQVSLCLFHVKLGEIELTLTVFCQIDIVINFWLLTITVSISCH